MNVTTPHAPHPPNELTTAELLALSSQRAGLGDLAKRLIELRSWLAGDLSEVESAITVLVQTANQADTVAHSAAGHLLDTSGKRLRPICVLLAARAIGVDTGGRFTDSVRDLATACELVHTATLLHDDVIDEGTLRRGKETSRMVYGNAASILGGDHLLVSALRRVATLPVPYARQPLTQSLLSTIDEMVRAEAIQLEQRHRIDLDQNRYDEVVDGKTAALFSWALESPTALLTEATPGRNQLAKALREAGKQLGRAFQLADDVLDFTAAPTELGKDLFADLMQGKATWPLIVACQHDAVLRAAIESQATTTDVDSTDGRQKQVHDWVRRVRASGALEATRARAAACGQQAIGHLLTLPPSRARDALVVVAEVSIHRVR